MLGGKYNEVVKEASSGTRTLLYTPDFKKLIGRNPHAVKTVQGLITRIQAMPQDQAHEPNSGKGTSSLEENGVSVTLVKFPEKSDDFFKVELEGKAFFVKKSGLESGWGGGAEEMNSLRSAADVVKDLDKVKVVPCKLGFSDKSGNRYLVSEWLDYPRLDNHLQSLGVTEEGIRLKKRSMEIESKLVDKFRDVMPRNMLYDPVSEIIYVYDITLV